MTIKFMTGVAGSLINIYRPDDLQTPIATVDAADDPEDMRGQIRDAVQAAYQIGLETAKSEPLKEDPRARKAVERAWNEGRRRGREQHAAELRALLDEGKKKRGPKK
ncbi:hypothetical protein ACH6YM_24660 [Klebsiella pneumoniae]|nr:hypothetical protein [Klebsiella pneumoniae]